MYLHHATMVLYFILVVGISASQIVLSQDAARAKYHSIKDIIEDGTESATTTITTEGGASQPAQSVKGSAIDDQQVHVEPPTRTILHTGK